MPEADGPSLRDHFAAERTLLAWVRTGLAMMGFGFVVARFSTADVEAVASWFGAALVTIGSLVNVLAAVDYRREVRRLSDAGVIRPASRMGMASALLLAAIGAGIAVYLVVIKL